MRLRTSRQTESPPLVRPFHFLSVCFSLICCFCVFPAFLSYHCVYLTPVFPLFAAQNVKSCVVNVYFMAIELLFRLFCAVLLPMRWTPIRICQTYAIICFMASPYMEMMALFSRGDKLNDALFSPLLWFSTSPFIEGSSDSSKFLYVAPNQSFSIDDLNASPIAVCFCCLVLVSLHRDCVLRIAAFCCSCFRWCDCSIIFSCTLSQSLSLSLSLSLSVCVYGYVCSVLCSHACRMKVVREAFIA